MISLGKRLSQEKTIEGLRGLRKYKKRRLSKRLLRGQSKKGLRLFHTKKYFIRMLESKRRKK